MDIFGGLNLSKNANDLRKKFTGAMDYVKQESLTAVDVTSRKMSEGVALVNSADTKVTGTLNDYKSSAVEQLDGIVGAMSGGSLNFKDITKAVRVGRDGVTFDENDILSTVTGAMGYSVNRSGGAMMKIARDISGEFTRITGLNIGQILTSDGKKFSVNRNWRSMAGEETFRQIRRYTNMDDYIDVSVQAAIRSSIMKQAAELGMRDSYKSIWDNYPQGLGYYKRDAVLEAISTMITNGDILSVKAVADLLDRDGKNAIISKYPNLVEKIFSSFKFDDDVFPEDYPALRIEVMDLLTDLIGENWYYRNTEFGKALNLTVINSASKDIMTLLGGIPELVPLLCAAGVFRETSAKVELRRQFPTAPQFDY